MRPFDLLQPQTVDEAVALLGEQGDDARVIAGGAMLTILLRQRIIAPSVLVSIADIAGLDSIEANDGGLRIGANATLRSLERSSEVAECCPVLREALGLVANVRVRNVATIGGHLAHADPHLDLPPVLLALDASVRVRGSAREGSIPLGELITGYYETALGPDELVVGLDIPPLGAGWHGTYLKYCSLTPTDWPTVGVAAFLLPAGDRLADVRIVAGSVADRPLRVPEAEALLRGARPTASAVAEVARRYAQAADPLEDVRGSVEYKRTVTEVYVRRAFAEAARRAGMSIAG
ncbi:MAG: aerobic carbon-monoxide dehydrogenase medium subunit [Chloroflexota bacterium]|jgi:carbon-monoxide dehydrogenase medium subunit|nr:aerobic carbon-monoxide dehydrogenase medium subunit [Chloroflexota bacterium]